MTCKKCGQDKPLTDYYGHNRRCRTCIREQQRARRAADPQAARERSRAYNRAFRERHYEAELERERRKMRARYEADPQAARERSRGWARKAATETARQADRNGCEWTSAELEIATRPGLSARQAALILGRTYAAVGNVRRRAR
jgi:hypothetical protein